jgi:hypothetical protein
VAFDRYWIPHNIAELFGIKKAASPGEHLILLGKWSRDGAGTGPRMV